MKAAGQNTTKRATPDEFTVYGQHVANELRCLKDTKYRLMLAETKQKINAALYEAEIRRFTSDSQVSHPPAPAETH
jgi:hypothetical protein